MLAMADPSHATRLRTSAQESPPGTRRTIDGEARVHYCGYWVKTYPAPADTLRAKRELIVALTRRLFNHVEHGLNIPGHRLEEARAAYDQEPHEGRKRVIGAMLAGALFNRATDIFTKLVEMQALGIEIRNDNPLLRDCEGHFQEALHLGKTVLHRSGEEGIDELWGEPMKAFTLSIEDFYESRYVKIAYTMREIDDISDALGRVFEGVPMFHGVATLIRELSEAAKRKVEVLRTDPEIFDVWARFAVAAENLSAFQPFVLHGHDPSQRECAMQGVQLLRAGKGLLYHITRARVRMPKSARDFIARCELYRETHFGMLRALSS